MNHESLARVCYDAVRAYGLTIGEPYVRWENARAGDREGFVGAVNFLMEVPKAGIADLHDHWRTARTQRGWQQDQSHDELRQHPAMVPWPDLPERERLKFELVFRIVEVFRGHVLPRLEMGAAPIFR